MRDILDDAKRIYELTRRTLPTAAREMHHPAEAWDGGEDLDGLRSLLGALSHATRGHKLGRHSRERGRHRTSYLTRAGSMDHRLDVQRNMSHDLFEYSAASDGFRIAAQLDQNNNGGTKGPLQELLDCIVQARGETVRKQTEGQIPEPESSRPLWAPLNELA